MHVILTLLLAIPWITGERINPADVTYVEGTAPPELVAGPASNHAKVYFASTIRPDTSSKFDRFVNRQYTYTTPRPAAYSTESSVGTSTDGYEYSRGGVKYAPTERDVVSSTYNPVTVTVGPKKAVPVNLENEDSSYVSPAYRVSSTTYPTISSTSGHQAETTMSRGYSRISQQPQAGRSRNYTISFGNPVKAQPVSLRYTSTTPEPLKSRATASPKSAAFIDGHTFVESQDVALISSTLAPHVEYAPTVVDVSVTPIPIGHEHVTIHPIPVDHGHVPIHPIPVDHGHVPIQPIGIDHGLIQPGVKTRKIEVRRPAIRKEFYDIEEHIIIRPAGSVLLELDHPLVSSERDNGGDAAGARAGEHSGSYPETKRQPSSVPSSHSDSNQGIPFHGSSSHETPNQGHIPVSGTIDRQAPQQPSTQHGSNNQVPHQQPIHPAPNPQPQHQPPTHPPPTQSPPADPPSTQLPPTHPTPTHPSPTYPSPIHPAPSDPPPSHPPQSNPPSSYSPPSLPPPSHPLPSHPPPSNPLLSHPTPSYPSPSPPTPNYQPSQNGGPAQGYSGSVNPSMERDIYDENYSDSSDYGKQGPSYSQESPKAVNYHPSHETQNEQNNQNYQPNKHIGESSSRPFLQTSPGVSKPIPRRQEMPISEYESPVEATHPSTGHMDSQGHYPKPEYSSKPSHPGMIDQQNGPRFQNNPGYYQSSNNQGYQGSTPSYQPSGSYQGNSYPTSTVSYQTTVYHGSPGSYQFSQSYNPGYTKGDPQTRHRGQGSGYSQGGPQTSHGGQDSGYSQGGPQTSDRDQGSGYSQGGPQTSRRGQGSGYSQGGPQTSHRDQGSGYFQAGSQTSHGGQGSGFSQGGPQTSHRDQGSGYFQAGSQTSHGGQGSGFSQGGPQTSHRDQGSGYSQGGPQTSHGGQGSEYSQGDPQTSHRGQGSGYSQGGPQTSHGGQGSGYSEGDPQTSYRGQGSGYSQGDPQTSHGGQGSVYSQSGYQNSGNQGYIGTSRPDYHNSAGQHYQGNQGSYPTNHNQYYPSGQPPNYQSQTSGHDSTKQPISPSFGTTEHYGDYNDVKLYHTKGPSMENDRSSSSHPTHMETSSGHSGYPESSQGSYDDDSVHPSTSAQPPVYEKYHPQQSKSGYLREEPCTHNKHMQQSRLTSTVAPSPIRALSHPEDDDDSVVIEARVTELEPTSTERQLPRFSQRNHHGYRRPSQEQRDYLHQAELQSKQDTYRGRQRYESNPSNEFGRLSEAPETNFDRNNVQSSTPRVRYQEYYQAKQYPVYSRSRVTSMRPVDEDYSTQSFMRPTTSSPVPQNQHSFRQSTAEQSRPIYASENPRFATTSTSRPYYEPIQRQRTLEQSQSPRFSSTSRQYFEPGQSARQNYSTFNNTYQVHDSQSHPNFPSNYSARITISNHSDQTFHPHRRRLPSPIHYSPQNTSFRTDTPMPRMVSIGQPDFRYPPYVETRSHGAPLQTHSKYEVEEYPNSEKDDSSFPAVTPRPKLTPEQSSANQKQYIELLFAQGKVAEVGLGPAESNGGLELSQNGYLRGRVIAATPAPPHAEARETVHTRRIVVSQPFETVQEIEINEPLTKLERFTSNEPVKYHTGSDHVSTYQGGHGHYQEPSYRGRSYYSAVH